jgi:membrane protein required for colicin V production
MNWLDVLVLIIVGVSLLASVKKGLSRELIGLAAVIAAVVLGAWFYGTAGSYVMPYVSSPSIANFIGFVVVFSVVLAAGGIVGYIAGRILKLTGLSLFDRILGAAFGIVRGILIAVALVMAILAFSAKDRPPAAVVESKTAPYVVDAARVFAAIAPHELKEGFRKSYAQVKSAWENAWKQGTRGTEKAEHERKI